MIIICNFYKTLRLKNFFLNLLSLMNLILIIVLIIFFSKLKFLDKLLPIKKNSSGLNLLRDVILIFWIIITLIGSQKSLLHNLLTGWHWYCRNLFRIKRKFKCKRMHYLKLALLEHSFFKNTQKLIINWGCNTVWALHLKKK